MWFQNSDNADNKCQVKDSFISTGCNKLDEFLRGGLIRKGITEIYGESGTGKTQLALQLCLSAQVPLENSEDIGGAAYISTEAAFPSKRLQELIEKSPISKKYNVTKDIIFIEHISETKDLENCIFNPERLQYLLSKHKIKLLIIDSITATYRMDSDVGDLTNRAKSLRKIGYHLRKLAITHKIAIVCINQVTAIVKNFSEEECVTEKPSLGITWASMTNNSFYLYKKNNCRYLQISGSSYLPNKTIEYKIYDYGVMAINN